ncbi:hypothetical protein [Hydrogenophaga sp.]|uniref:hypothetical protein n=1 Tax=Hydrogenophaga sp. TaxID=1904254 RepID=UPI000EF0C4FA|nr:MAG: hypothetical protein C4535_11865 [Comamonadaceae bacterium]
MYGSILALMFALLSAGCASTAATFFNRPVVEDSVKNSLSTISLAADRRTVVVVTDGENRGKFCAEPPPDTATGLKTELDAALEAKAQSDKVKAEIEGKASLKDKLETSVTVIAERTAPLDAFRTGVYALCQFHLNGAIDKTDIKPLFEKLIDSFRISDAAKGQK